MNTCMAQLPGKCENVLTRPSCLDGSSSAAESERNKKRKKSAAGAVEGSSDMKDYTLISSSYELFIIVVLNHSAVK